MKMDIVDSCCGFAGEAGGVEILDIVVSRIEQVDDFDGDLEILICAEAETGVQLEGRLGFDTAIPVEGAWGEIPGSKARERTGGFSGGDASGEAHGNRVLDEFTGIEKTPFGDGQLGIDGEPGLGAPVVGPLESVALARSTGFDVAGVPDIDELGGTVEIPEGCGRGQVGNTVGADSEGRY